MEPDEAGTAAHDLLGLHSRTNHRTKRPKAATTAKLAAIPQIVMVGAIGFEPMTSTV
jgi:hypothetical protein